MLAITEIDGRIAVTGNTYPIREVLKALPGRKWDKQNKAWTFPRTAYSFGLLTEAFPHAVVNSTLVELEEQRQLLTKAMEAKQLTHYIPYPSRTRPWLHQARSHYFAKNRLIAQGGAMLALDMGTGKSKVTIDLINDPDLNIDRVLISCPTSVMDVWPDEFERHSENHYPVHVCDRKHSIARRVQEASDFLYSGLDTRKVVVINHEAIWREPFLSFAKNEEFDLLVVDECHRAKSPGGKLSRQLFEISKKVEYVLGLTGTPTPHSIDDFYAQARFIDESVHGTSHQVYKSQYLVQVPGHNGTYTKVVGFKNTDDWNEKFHSMAIQVRADDVLDLPEAVHTTRYCDLSPDESAAYNEMREFMCTQVESGMITAANALVKLLRLAQITQGTVTDESGDEREVGTSKRDLLIDTLTDIDKSEPVVVFSRFKCDLRNIGAAARACGRQCFELSGKCNELAAWKEAAEYGPVIAVQLQAGGVGISMVQAKYCIYMSKDFSLGNYEQSLARVHRPGQNRNVTYIHLVAKGTIDETINKALAQRKNTVEEILAEMGG